MSRKLIANLGDASPFEYGGYFIFQDEDGSYEAEYFHEPVYDPDNYKWHWRIYRFSLDRCTFINGILSDNEFHPDHPAWFAKPDLKNLAEFVGMTSEEFAADLCSDDWIKRAVSWESIGSYHGFENLDSYPYTITDRSELEERYKGWELL